jgi:5-amino-6-(5-phosphoribosylamino)uracil reductase
MHVLLSAAVSADGYLDDAAAARLLLSDEADLDQVDEIRASSDAIMVGAQTIRADDPGLTVKSPARRQERMARCQPANPLKVTITRSGDLDPRRRFFAEADRPPLVYAGPVAAHRLDVLRALAEIVPVPDPDGEDLRWVVADLASRGIRRLMVEGGARVLEQFLAAGLADELRLAIAPVFVADPAAPRLRLPVGRLRLTGITEVGRMSVLRYLPGTGVKSARVVK